MENQVNLEARKKYVQEKIDPELPVLRAETEFWELTVRLLKAQVEWQSIRLQMKEAREAPKKEEGVSHAGK